MAKKSAAKKTVKKAAKKTIKKSATVSANKVVKESTKTAVKKSTKKAVKKTATAAIEKNTKRYIPYVPKTIPAGKILCHNGVIPQTPDQRPGFDGFRSWIDDDTKSAKYGPCNCGWSGLPHHMPLAWLESDRKEYDARKFRR